MNSAIGCVQLYIQNAAKKLHVILCRIEKLSVKNNLQAVTVITRLSGSFKGSNNVSRLQKFINSYTVFNTVDNEFGSSKRFVFYYNLKHWLGSIFLLM